MTTAGQLLGELSALDSDSAHIGSWNSLLWPLMVTQSHNVQPVEVALARFLENNSVDWRRLSAASIFTTLPVIGIFLLLQKHIIRGISRGEGIQG